MLTDQLNVALVTPEARKISHSAGCVSTWRSAAGRQATMTTADSV